MLRLMMTVMLLLGLIAAPATAGTFTPISAEDQTAQMGRGVNIIGYDPYWQDGGPEKPRGNYEDRHFKAIKDAGFSTVRVVLFTFPHMDAQNQLSDTWLKKLDWVVDTALKYDLIIILDEHDFTDCSKDPATCETKLTAVWRQLAPRYQDRSNRVIFEVLNEPHDKLDAATWNALFPKVLATIRATNPQRNVIVGGTQWNSRNTLKDLKLPENDRHLIATFHYYDPFNFTHQGASWASPDIMALRGITWGSEAQRAQIDADFDAVQAWSDANKRPILLGEFGAYDKAPLESRIVWTDAVARSAEKHGFAWAYWQFSSDFIVWDFAKDDWNRPILGALIPDSPALPGVSAAKQVSQMGPGINIIGGYDPYWNGQPSTFRLDTDLKLAREAGFTTVRIPLFTFAHMKPDGKLDPAWVKRLDAVVAEAQKHGFQIILDEHDFDDCAKDTDACAVLLANVWYELSEHFKDAPDTVMFELLNEPHGTIDAAMWNSWAADLLGIVRETNPSRNVIVGPVFWNSRDYLDQLQLPADDRHLIVTFHYYDPFHFTHQGASWAGPEVEKLSGIRWTGSAAEVAQINTDFDKVAAWSKLHDRPILLGEYGAYNMHGKLEDRAAWTKAVSKASDARGFARAYWYWDGGFGVWDEQKRQWVQPIKDALVGQ